MRGDPGAETENREPPGASTWVDIREGEGRTPVTGDVYWSPQPLGGAMAHWTGRIAAAVLAAGVAAAFAGARAENGILGADLPGAPVALATLDADGDGLLDLVVSLEGAPFRLALLRNGGGGRFEAAVAFPDLPGDSHGAIRTLTAVDVDRDGRVDVVGVGFPSALWRHRGDGTFAVEPLSPWVDGGRVVAGDLDGDGFPDLAVAKDGGLPVLLVLRNDGNGRFRALPPVAMPDAWPVRGMVIADVEPDGMADVALLGGGLGRVLLFRGRGEGVLADPGLLEAPPGCFALAVRPADGALLAHGAETVRIFSGDAFVDMPSDGADLEDGGVLSDIDGDDRPDLVTTTADGRLVALLERAGRFVRVDLGEEARRIEPAPPGASSRVVVLGLDGADAALVAVLVRSLRKGSAIRLFPEAASEPEGVLSLERGSIADRGPVKGVRIHLSGSIPAEAVRSGEPLHLEVAAGDAFFEGPLVPEDPSSHRANPIAPFPGGRKFDPVTGSFTVFLRGIDLPVEPSNPVRVTLRSRERSWSHEGEWTAGRRGDLAWPVAAAPGRGTGDPIPTGPPATPKAPESPFGVVRESVDGREVDVLRERDTGRSWTLEAATGRWLPRARDLDRPDASLAEGLVAFLPLGGSVEDARGGTVRTHGDAAPDGDAVRMDGTGWLELPHVPLHDHAHAFSMWVRPDGDADAMGLVEQRDANAGGRHYHLMLRGGGRPYLGFYMNDLIAPDPLQRGRWHHLVFQYTGKEQEIWVDGSRVARRASAPYRGTTGATRIGRNPSWNNVGGTHFAGSMRRVRVYDRSLDGTEVERLFRRELPDGFEAPPRPTLVFEGPIDGSDRIVITAAGAKWENVFWGTPRGIFTLNGVPWEPRKDAELVNGGETRFLPPGVDLSRARLVSVTGRDYGGIVTAPGRLVLRFVDSPNGPDTYRVVVAFD